MTTMLGCGRHVIWRTVSKGQFTCRNVACESQAAHGKASYRVLQAQKWVRVCFLPLVPLGRDSQVVECISCLASFPAGVIDAQPAQAAPATGHDGAPSIVDFDCEAAFTHREAPALRVFAPSEERRPTPARLIVGLGVGRVERDPEIVVDVATPEPPQRPACTSCGICGEARSSTADLCESCGAVFVDRVARSCVRHQISLPSGVSCPGCEPDGVAEFDPVETRASFLV